MSGSSCCYCRCSSEEFEKVCGCFMVGMCPTMHVLSEVPQRSTSEVPTSSEIERTLLLKGLNELPKKSSVYYPSPELSNYPSPELSNSLTH